MTLSPKKRSEAIHEALSLVLIRIGEERFDVAGIYFSQEPFNCIPMTTWYELQERGWSKRWIGQRGCTLTGSGWREAIRATGRLDDGGFADGLSRLSATLKGYVKGRSDDSYAKTRSVATDSSVTAEFVFNVIESRLLDHHFKIYGAEWSDRPHVIRVPLNFGLRRLSLREPFR